MAVVEAAEHLCGVLADSPVGDVLEFAGPEPVDSTGLAHQWADSQQPSPRVLALPLPGKLSSAFRNGAALSGATERGRTTYAGHLTSR